MLEAELAVTVAMGPNVPVTTTGTLAVFVTPPKLSEMSIDVVPADTPNTTPCAFTSATVADCVVKVGVPAFEIVPPFVLMAATLIVVD
jgi:hypothetical protein